MYVIPNIVYLYIYNISYMDIIMKEYRIQYDMIYIYIYMIYIYIIHRYSHNICYRNLSSVLLDICSRLDLFCSFGPDWAHHGLGQSTAGVGGPDLSVDRWWNPVKSWNQWWVATDSELMDFWLANQIEAPAINADPVAELRLRFATYPIFH
jgi:hypothetical protein